MQDWPRIRRLFEDLVELPPAEQAEALSAVAPGLRAEVEALLAAEAEATALDQPLPELRPSALDIQGLRGQQIGGFEVLDCLGQGGMGLVFEARQQQPQRRVALKMLSAPLATEAERARFAFEVETLGRLEHPSIAQIFDAGTWIDPATGRALPWFAMELVEGARPLDRYAAEEGLDLTQKLNLLAEVAEAVQFGHARGVLHRDLKPDNILVDRRGRPKVIDFGTARSTDPASTRYTMAGMVLGTPAYMSPEQFDGDPDAVDAQTDVYALGVVLYQLVCGRLPFDPQDQSLTQFLQRVRREAIPAPTSQQAGLPVELDWICGAALAKERAERYPTVQSLVADLRRLPRHETLSVGPVSARLALRRFVRRNKALVAGALAVALSLAGGAIVAGIGWSQAAAQATRASKAEQLARSEADAQAAALGWFAELAGQARPGEAGREVPLLTALEGGVRRLAQLRAEPAVVEVTIRNAIASTFLALEQPLRSQAILDAGRGRAEQELGPEHSATLQLRYLRGWALADQGQHDAAVAELQACLEGRRARFGADSAPVGEALYQLAVVRSQQGAAQQARDGMRAAAAALAAALGPDHRLALRARATLAKLIDEAGDPEAALRLLEETRRRAEQVLGSEHDSVMTMVGNEAVLRSDAGQTAAALPLFERALAHKQASYGEESPAVLQLLSNLAGARTRLGEVEVAERLLRRVVAIHDKHPRDPVQALIARNNLAATLRRAGRAGDSIDVYTDLMGRTEKLVGKQHWLLAAFQTGYGTALVQTGSLAAAERSLLAALETLQGQFGDRHARSQATLRQLVALYQAWKKPEAEARYRARLQEPGK